MKDDLVPEKFNSKILCKPGVNAYDGGKLNHILMDELPMWQVAPPSKINWHSKNYRFWLSVIKKEKCLFSRQNGYRGKIIFGHSIRLRLFNINII